MRIKTRWYGLCSEIKNIMKKFVSTVATLHSTEAMGAFENIWNRNNQTPIGSVECNVAKVKQIFYFGTYPKASSHKLSDNEILTPKNLNNSTIKYFTIILCFISLLDKYFELKD